MLKQKSGSVVTITAALADQPLASVHASVSMMTKGGLNSATKSLAIDAKEGIRFNAVAPGVVSTPLHKEGTKESLSTRQPTGEIAEVKDIVDAVLYLVQARQVGGEVLHVDGVLTLAAGNQDRGSHSFQAFFSFLFYSIRAAKSSF